VWLSRNGSDVFEIGVVVKDDRAVLLGNRGGDDVDYTGSPMLSTGCHPKLHLSGAPGDRVGDRQVDVQGLPPLGDRLHVRVVPARVPGFEVNRQTGGGCVVDDQPGDHRANHRVLAPGLRRGIN
jgi:hypothetical protein